MPYPSAGAGATRFIDPDILSRISNLEMVARHVVEGFITGLHDSPYRGFSVEFLGYHPYIPGDDPMRIDWKLYARSDRLFVKEYEDETNTCCHILLDMSRSMGYSSNRITKFQYGAVLAASLAYFMIRQRDRVGLYCFDDRIRERIPAKSSKGHLVSILHSLENLAPGAVTAMGRPFHELADTIRKRGIVVIVSDLLDDPDTILSGLKHFRFAGNDVILFHIMDPAEVTFRFPDIVELEDMETAEKIMVMSDEARDSYLANLAAFQTRLRTECGLMKIDYSVLETSKPLDFALFQYLSRRSARK